MKILSYFKKPSIYDENAFYVLEQIINILGDDIPYMLVNFSEGFYNLIRKSGWRQEYMKDTNRVILFPDLTKHSTLISCRPEDLHKYYNQLKRKD